MDNQSTFKQFFRAVFHELFRSKALYNLLASCVLLGIVIIGFFWEAAYISQTSITIGEQNIADVQGDDASYQNLSDRLSSMYESRTFQETVVTAFGDVADTEKTLLQSLFTVKRQAIFTLENSTLAKLTYVSGNPGLSQQRLMIILDALLASVQPESQRESLLQQAEQLGHEKKRLETELKELDDHINQLRLSNVDEGTRTSKQRITQVQESIQDVKVNISVSRAKIGGIIKKMEKESVTIELQRRLGDMTNRRNQFEKNLARLRDEQAPSQETIRLAEVALDKLNQEIAQFTKANANNLQRTREESESLHSDLRNKLSLEEVDLASLIRREESLGRLLGEVRSKATEDEGTNIDIEQYQRTRDNVLSQITEVESRLQENRLAQEAESQLKPHYSVLDKPNLPKTYTGLGFIEFLIIGPLIASLLPFLIASCVVLFDARIRTMRQLRMYKPQTVPVLTVPHHDSPKTLRVFRKAIMGLMIWGIFVFSVYVTIGVIGLKH